MKISLKKVQNISNSDNNDVLLIDNLDQLIAFIENSYASIKVCKSFVNLINDLITNNKLENIKNKYLVDHKSYCNLFLIFDNLDQILWYVQDTCEARGDTIPKTINSAINYLISEKTVIYEIDEFQINVDELNQLHGSFNKL